MKTNTNGSVKSNRRKNSVTNRKDRYVAPRSVIRVDPKTGQNVEVILSRQERAVLYKEHRIQSLIARQEAQLEKMKARFEAKTTKIEEREAAKEAARSARQQARDERKGAQGEFRKVNRLAKRVSRLVGAFTKQGLVTATENKRFVTGLEKATEIGDVKNVLSEVVSAI